MSIHFVTCPNCGTEFNAERKFCPNCHLPRSRVAAELRRASEQTGIPFNELVIRAWEQEEHNAPPDLPDREPVNVEIDSAAILRKNKRWLGAIGAVVFACVALFVIALIANPDGGTDAEEPSRARLSNISSGSQSESDYFAELSDISNAMAGSMNRFTVLTGDPRLLDSTWVASANDELAIWRTNYQKARRMDPPSGFEALHTSYLKALQHYDEAAQLIGQGINNIDSQKMDEGIDELDEGNRLISQINEEMQDLR